MILFELPIEPITHSQKKFLSIFFYVENKFILRSQKSSLNYKEGT